jgi:signal transduction histidine kinase
MPKRFNSLLMLFALGLLVGWIGGGASAPDTSHANLQLPSRAIAIVDKAHRLINQDDLMAFEEIDRDPTFHQGGLYLFVLSADGENIYHAADRTQIGEDFSRKLDAKQRPYGQQLIRDVSSRGVWHAYQSNNTASGHDEWKLTYARQTRQGHIVASGIYAGTDASRAR